MYSLAKVGLRNSLKFSNKIAAGVKHTSINPVVYEGPYGSFPGHTDFLVEGGKFLSKTLYSWESKKLNSKELIEERYNFCKPLVSVLPFRTLDEVMSDKTTASEFTRELLFKLVPNRLNIIQDELCVDTRVELNSYKMRKGYDAYGMKGDPFSLNTTLMVHAILEHAAGLHIAESELLSTILRHFDPSTSLYQLCIPFMYDELNATRAAVDVLCHEKGILRPMFGFTDTEFDKVFKEFAITPSIFKEDYISKPEKIKKIFYYEEGVRLWNIISLYIREGLDAKDLKLMNEIRPRLLDELVNHIHRGIWLHQFYTNMFDLQARPDLSSTSICDDISKSYRLTTVIGASTTFRYYPLLLETDLPLTTRIRLNTWSNECLDRVNKRIEGVYDSIDNGINYRSYLPRYCSTGLHQ